MNKVQKLIAAAIAANGYVIDDHSGQTSQFTMFGLYTSFRNIEYVIPLMEDLFCINPIKFGRDEAVHLEQWSVGGVIDARYKSVKEAAVEYNKQGSGKVTAIYELQGDGTAAFTLLEESK